MATFEDKAKVRMRLLYGDRILLCLFELVRGGFADLASASDAVGDLTGVNQSGRVRTFSYDSLGRLLSAANPESGTVSYTYDSVGNELSRTDARGIKTTYAYDALNRVTSQSYSDGTPAVSYSYDPGIANGKGQLGSVANGNSTTSYTSFDAVGNVLASNQATAGESYPFAYAYNLAGAPTSESYPSGRVVTTSYDGANRPATLNGSYAGVATPYVKQAAYAPHGGLESWWYGNGVFPAWIYNSRLQPTTSYATLNNNGNYYLGVTSYAWGASASGNNGTLSGMGEGSGAAVPYGSLNWFSQSFTYDNANRLSAASDTGGWSRSFGYDAFGNLWVTGNAGVTLAGNTPVSNVFNGNNRITGASYDAAGNQLAVNGDTITYDAEDRQASATEPPALGGGTVQYFYDGAGQRVEKLMNGNLTVYAYDALGRMAGEYGSGNAQTAACHTCYPTWDHLGSARMVTDELGAVVARHDYLPYGEEIAGEAAGRSFVWNADDSVDQKFTGQFRDTETGEDFFQARYFAGALGRFTSPDPGNAGA